MRSELRLMKDRLEKDYSYKNKTFEDLREKYQNLNNLVLEKDKEYHNKLTNQKSNLLNDQRSNRDQFRKLEEVRMEKLFGESEYMKSLISGLERRVKD